VAGEVVAHRSVQHEVPVGEGLHQGAGTEPVGAVVGEVGLTDHEQARDGGLQVVVHPQSAHGVVHRGVDAHGHFPGVLPGDLLIHLEQVAVLARHCIRAQALDGFGEVQVNPAPAGAHTASFVADLLGGAGGDVPRDQVAEGRITPFQEVVAFLIGDVPRVPVVATLLGNPDAAVVAQRLAHQRQLGLVVAGDRDAGGVDLGVARVGEVGALAVRAPGGGGVAAHGVGGQEVHVAVAAGAQHHHVGGVGLDLAGDHVPHHDASGAAVDHDQFEHLVAGVHLHVAGSDLPLQGLVGAQQ